jgi:hypothetical protein
MSVQIIQVCYLCQRTTTQETGEGGWRSVMIPHYGRIHPRIMPRRGRYNEQVELCPPCTRTLFGLFLRIGTFFWG